MDRVKNRMESGEGMSVSEFLYPLIQAWDWIHLYFTKMTKIQIGGADQFGNILAGAESIDAICRTPNAVDVSKPASEEQDGDGPKQKAAGFTVPLLTTSSGDKFGKSAGNAVWLDAKKTSPFDLYQVCSAKSTYIKRQNRSSTGSIF